MKDWKYIQKPNFLLDLSFVLCSCAKQPPAGLDKLDTKCFDYYSILKATDENNGVFGKDSFIFNDMSCKPYINLTAFNECQADNYVKALIDIIAYTEVIRENYDPDSVQYELLTKKISICAGYKDYALQEKNFKKESRSYRCVLEIIDSWFNTADKVRMSNKMESVLKAKKIQAEFAETIVTATKNLEVAEQEYYTDEIKETLDQWFDERFGGFNPTQKEQKHTSLKEKDYGAELSVEYWEELAKEKKIKQEEIDKIREPYDEWKAEEAILNDFFSSVYDCKNKIDMWAVTSYPPSYKAEEDMDIEGVYIDDIDVLLEDIRTLKTEVDQTIAAFKSVEKIAIKHKLTKKLDVLNQGLQNVYNNLKELEDEINKLKNDIYITKAVTEDSFLVCRCGGIIKVVQNGDWVNISKDQLVPNICDMLKYAEQYLYQRQSDRHSKDIKFSIIKAFNIVHGALMHLNEDKPTGLDYIIDKECEEARVPAAHIEITVRPKSDMLKQAKQIDAFGNAMSFVPYIGVGFTLVMSVGSIMESIEESNKFRIVDNFDSIEAITNVLYHKFVKGGEIVKKAVGEVLDKYSTAITLITIMNDLTYKSYAAFIGQIQITITTHYECYNFIGNFDILGRKEGEYKMSLARYEKAYFFIQEPEDNRTNIKYKIYEDGMFYQGVESDIMY